MNRINGYIVKQEALNLEEAIKKAEKSARSSAAKRYFEEISKLPEEDQQKWFFTSDQLKETETPSKYKVDKVVQICTEIVMVCTVIQTIIKIFSTELGKWIYETVEKEICKEKEVVIPCPPNESVPQTPPST